MGIREEDMEGLSDEERAALQDDDDESEILGKIAGDDGSDDDEGDDDDDESTTATSEKDAARAADGDAGKGGEQDSAEGDSDESDGNVVTTAPDEFQPELKAAAPEGLTEKIAEIDAKIKALREQRREGSIELDAYDEQKDALDEQKFELKIAADRANWAQSQNEETREQRWKWEQERFFGQEKAKMYEDPVILAALNASVKQIASDKANANKPASFFLEEADRQIRKRFNMGEPAVKETKQLNRQPDLTKVPKTLAQLPAAEMAETGDVEFAYLDKLDGIALEAALRKLTPEQEARYLGAA